MSVISSEVRAGRAPRSWSAYRPGGLPDLRESLVSGMGEALFTSFVRRDQRRKGEQYLRGLLCTPGRKSIRNIAAQEGGSASEQSLHHFISSSTWDWRPVREALAGYLTEFTTHQAWVVHPLFIPKAGDQSVGVDYGVDPCTGVFRGQRAFGVWHSGGTLNTPVNWRLFLPDPWLGDTQRRRQAEIPEETGRETLEQCATNAALEMLLSWKAPLRPVVLNTHINRIAETVQRFTAAGVTVVARVRGTARLLMGDPALPGYNGGVLEAQRILESVRGLRRPVAGRGQDAGTLAAAVRVMSPGALPRQRAVGTAEAVGGLALVGEWPEAGGPLGALWVTNATAAPAEWLSRLTRLGGRACQDLSGAGEDVGLKDFEGRSFRGWHRHMTLASAAHAVAALAGTVGTAPPAAHGMTA
ncbi:putative ISXo8 transposase [Streptomyces spiroverticillatus]|uniref:ISXo8 transposase n=1 Tax=Streptomyces finlayi TaxID=67296 RepID=A0A918WVE6_9ACTN|nr:transposase [Streptomyces finlayi]GHA01138.1 putative ISXo8 transposase [Streptomyces spiroverticillatus]GHC85595.1 putative ISXo8 transposase [Streptomyces finlayi]